MQVDISHVHEIIQDYSNRQIEIRNREGICLWRQKYSSVESFNKAFREMNKRLYEELKRREVAL